MPDPDSHLTVDSHHIAKLTLPLPRNVKWNLGPASASPATELYITAESDVSIEQAKQDLRAGLAPIMDALEELS